MASNDRDPFDDVVFDDAFVRAAGQTERSAEERAAQARLDEALLRIRPSVTYRPRRRTRWGVLLGIAAAVGFLAVIARGPGGDRAVPGGWGRGDDHFMIDGEVTRYPTPPAGVGDEPLRRAPIVPAHDSYAFIQTQDGAPVRWDPCRRIKVVVAGAEQVTGSDALLTEALDIVSRATGLVFEVEGPTTEVPVDDRAPVQDRYGDRWAPVLVAWTDPDTVSGLAGDVAGLGGPQAISKPGGSTDVFVTGGVWLDAPDLRSVLGRAGGREAVRGVVIHELAHLVGLGHVDDPTQLMYGGANDRSMLGPGDRAGLAALGDGPCVSGL